MAPIKLYHSSLSHPSRAIRLTAKQLGVTLTLQEVDLLKGEHMTPAFLKLNPAHAIPVLDDNGFALFESRAIMAYLVNQYAKDDKLYPKNPQQRALVDQMLYFDADMLYVSLSDYYIGILQQTHVPSQAVIDKIHERVSILDTILGKTSYVAGQSMTIADITLLVSITVLESMDIDYKKYSNVYRWASKMKKELNGYEEINPPGLVAFRELMETQKAGMPKNIK